MTKDSNTETIDTREKVKNITRGYIAGFFDAEGMIRVEKDGTPTVSIKQTYKPVLDYINLMFIGSVTKYTPIRTDLKVSFRLSILHEDKIRFLEYIYPNLIEKRNQAKLMLRYLKEIKPLRRDYFRLSETQRQQREWFCEELETLKHEKYDERELGNYENEIKKLQISRDIREGRQSTLFGLDCVYGELGIYKTENRVKEENTNHIPDMSEDVFFGYMIGFFDGEGYVGITKGKRDSYTLRIAVTNSNFDILNIYKNKYGGKIRPKTNKHAKEYHKKLWLWELFNNDMLLLLRKMYPYAKVKKEQIYYAIKFQEFHNTVRVINSSEKKKRADYYMLKLKELKKYTGENIGNCNNRSYENKTDKKDLNCQMSIEEAWGL
jgi:hypothetical protein